MIKVTRGDTEYCISAIPLGGYVKMAGEKLDDPRTGAPDEFLSKTKWSGSRCSSGPGDEHPVGGRVMAIVLAQGRGGAC